ncbi:sigma 54-interacting transcriptional regulator [Salipiger sp. P9]|uniref:sigma-54-dependent Fis family transcriptional regulator n=1 Tax=Salipiger pentaromativorans TaxID=2943193 RepID=UPI0021589412|nr:sigma 54-interacting transcriptional regulator [Salipiger pentaromativorans]MCR8548835.1 sigma 54-interacting transcriptional regulator [Salipiger pentaromativorans]
MSFHTTALDRARYQLETQGRFPGGALAGDISDSWLRSLSHGLDPLGRAAKLMLTPDRMRETTQRHEELIRFARPELELLFDQIAGSHFMIALGSPDGVVLDTLSDTDFAATEAGRTVVPGSVWTEELRGTNALGLCIATRRLAQVYGGEHFLRDHSGVSCISAPIFDGRGNLAGVLDASSCTAARQQHTAALVQMSASNIENCLLHAAHDTRVVLQFHPRGEYLGTLSVGMLVLEEDFRIHAVNRRGEMFLTGFPELIGENFDRIFEQRFEDVAHRLAQGETLRLRDRMGSAVSVRAVANRASFALAGRLRSWAPDPEPTRAAPAAPSRNPFKDVVIEDAELRRRLAALPRAARRLTPISIHGETGTGKEVVARLAHAASEREGPFVVLDGRMLREADFSAAFFGAGEEAPGLLERASGGSLFLDEVTALPLPAQATLARVLDSGEYRHPASGALLRCDVFVVAASGEGTSDLPFWLCRFPCNRALI